MAVIETPFILHPTLERITPPDALRPYTPIPNRQPNDNQNGMFSPIDWKGIHQEEMRKQIQQQMFSNDPIKDMQKEFANRVLLGPNNHPNETAKSETVAGVNPKPKTNKQKSDEAAQKNKDWVAQYRQKIAGAKTPLDPVSVDSQVNVALRDPVYGQATATGLTMGNNILNTWINAHNADARREAEELKTERWLKQAQDMADEVDYRRSRDALADKRYEESKKSIVRSDPYILDAFKEAEIRSNPDYQKDLDLLNTPYEAKDAADAARHQNELFFAKQRLDAAQESLPMRLTSKNKGIDTESTGGFFNRLTDALNLVPIYRYAALTGSERAKSDARMAMRKAGQKSFTGISPEALMKEAERNIAAGNTRTGVQQRKMAEIMNLYLRRNPNGVAKQSPDGSVIVLASPNTEAITLTPETVDRYAKEFNVGVTSR